MIAGRQWATGWASTCFYRADYDAAIPRGKKYENITKSLLPYRKMEVVPSAQNEASL